MFSGRIFNWSKMKSSGKILWWALLKRNGKSTAKIYQTIDFSSIMIHCPDLLHDSTQHLTYFLFVRWSLVPVLQHYIVWRWWCPELRSHYRILNIHILPLISKLARATTVGKGTISSDASVSLNWLEYQTYQNAYLCHSVNAVIFLISLLLDITFSKLNS